MAVAMAWYVGPPVLAGKGDPGASISTAAPAAAGTAALAALRLPAASVSQILYGVSLPRRMTGYTAGKVHTGDVGHRALRSFDELVALFEGSARWPSQLTATRRARFKIRAPLPRTRTIGWPPEGDDDDAKRSA